MLGGELAALQAPMFDGLSFNPFTLLDDGFGPAELGIGGRDVIQALMIALLVVVLDEGLDLGLKVPRPIGEGLGVGERCSAPRPCPRGTPPPSLPLTGGGAGCARPEVITRSQAARLSARR